jgi:hypothetical protein
VAGIWARRASMSMLREFPQALVGPQGWVHSSEALRMRPATSWASCPALPWRGPSLPLAPWLLRPRAGIASAFATAAAAAASAVARAALYLRIRRTFRPSALLGWRAPRWAALSREQMARRTASAYSSGAAVMAASALLMRVLVALRRERLAQASLLRFAPGLGGRTSGQTVRLLARRTGTITSERAPSVQRCGPGFPASPWRPRTALRPRRTVSYA